LRKTGEKAHQPFSVVALFRPFQRCDFAQTMIVTDEFLSLLVQRKEPKKRHPTDAALRASRRL